MNTLTTSLNARDAGIGAAYLAGYVLLDSISFIDPIAPYGITPWNPPTGLSFAVVLLLGRRFIPLLFVAPVLADLLVRQMPFGWALEFGVAAIIGTGYALALFFLLRPRTEFNTALRSPYDLFVLLATAAVSVALVVVSYVGVIVAVGIAAPEIFAAACLRYWIGDMIGIAVITPIALVFFNRAKFPKISLEVAGQFFGVVLALFVVFGFPHLQLFYMLFLPIVWIAVRSGLEGVTLGILLAQLGLVVGVRALPEGFDLTTFQAQMLVLSITGLMGGALVSERRRTELQLRLHQESLARQARLGSMGELAATIAHEINQPLMAAGTYSRMVRDALGRDSPADPSLLESAGKAAAQIERAAKVIKRLRALVRLDETERSRTSVERLLKEVLDLCAPDLTQSGIACRVVCSGDIPPVWVDLLQIEQVLLNVLRNSVEAIKGAGHMDGTITIEAKRIESGDVEVSIRDTGPGFPPELLVSPLPPFSTTKIEGLGVGLSLSRTIVEKHGGQLTVGGNPHGALVSFTLPPAPSHD